MKFLVPGTIRRSYEVPEEGQGRGGEQATQMISILSLRLLYRDTKNKKMF